jgi:hypothetical protein
MSARPVIAKRMLPDFNEAVDSGFQSAVRGSGVHYFVDAIGVQPLADRVEVDGGDIYK